MSKKKIPLQFGKIFKFTVIKVGHIYKGKVNGYRVNVLQSYMIMHYGAMYGLKSLKHE
jgi:hypothetical protein